MSEPLINSKSPPSFLSRIKLEQTSFMPFDVPRQLESSHKRFKSLLVNWTVANPMTLYFLVRPSSSLMLFFITCHKAPFASMLSSSLNVSTMNVSNPERSTAFLIICAVNFEFAEDNPTLYNKYCEESITYRLTKNKETFLNKMVYKWYNS